MGKIRDLAGMTFERLKVMNQAGQDKWKYIMWNCVCECGTVCTVRSSALIAGRQRSCGCLARDMSSIRSPLIHTTHGMSHSKMYKVFHAAKRRCTDPKNKHYSYYGGRGIEFRFQSFEEFYKELGDTPKGLTLDRTNNSGHYEPGNVRWATRSEQAFNTRRSLDKQISKQEVQP